MWTRMPQILILDGHWQRIVIGVPFYLRMHLDIILTVDIDVINNIIVYNWICFCWITFWLKLFLCCRKLCWIFAQKEGKRVFCPSESLRNSWCIWCHPNSRRWFSGKKIHFISIQWDFDVILIITYIMISNNYHCPKTL